MTLSDFYDGKKSENVSIKNKTKELTLILDIVQKINSSLKLNEVLKSVLSSALQITNTWRGFIVLKNSKNKLSFKIGLDEFGLNLSESSFSVSDLVVNDVFVTGEAIIIAGAENEEEKRYIKGSKIIPVQTIFCAPLIVEDEKIGVLYVDSPRRREIKKIDITYTFEILTEQAAIAINNALIHEKLEKEHRRTENAEKLKNDLLTLVSHEFRNPLNYMISHTQLLQNTLGGSLAKEDIESLKIINRGGERLLRSIELVMKTSEINSDSYLVKNEKINVIKDIIIPIIEQNINQAEKKEIKITLNNNLKNGSIVECDKHSLVMIFVHLIDNAIKFTKEGEVSIDVYTELETGKIIVEINDTGIGISKDYLPYIFEQFSQEESGYTRSYDGMGLGLALVKSYCDLNGIIISVESEKNIGSKFKVEFNQYF